MDEKRPTRRWFYVTMPAETHPLDIYAEGKVPANVALVTDVSAEEGDTDG